MITKVMLYFNTIKYMKPSQVFYRLKKKLGMECTIGCLPQLEYDKPHIIKTPLDLDMDCIFLERYNPNEILMDIVTFLNSSRKFVWNKKWKIEEESDLWNFNLHYFDYLFSMLDLFFKSSNKEYLNKTIYCIENWIEYNPVGNGFGWSPYTIDIRLTNWISYYCMIHQELSERFKKKMIKSMHEQYLYLSKHIEKDILGNHYFEDLKTLVLCSIFFDDKPMLEKSLILFKLECREEILKDGMHYELSFMYHKIVLEGLLRVVIALKGIGRIDEELKKIVQSMLDVAWSFEEGLERIPLFNDSGDNVGKSLKSIVMTCKNELNIEPLYKDKLLTSGFYIFKWDDYKLIVDAGQIGPKYIPGHAHCDALSFELYKNGRPLITNCGTYGYQCLERQFYRGTSAHNTVMINGMEQSQCWGAFRVAKRCKVNLLEINDSMIKIKLVDQNGKILIRTINIFEHNIKISDYSKGNYLTSYYHLLSKNIKLISDNDMYHEIQNYSPEYGVKNDINVYYFKAKDNVEVTIDLRG